MQILKGPNGKVAKLWVDDLAKVESQSLDQIRLMLQIPALYEHIAIMPDTHLGKGAVVGGVVALKNAYCPNIVGVDIGCGMSAYKTGVHYEPETMNKEFWNNWKMRVNRMIPVGFNKHDRPQDMGELANTTLRAPELEKAKFENASKQLGTLGGGNHFLEAQVDADGNIWLMVHSGSRNTGLKIASFYNEKAKELEEKYHFGSPTDLWYLPSDDKYGDDYAHDMGWAVAYALENRWRMLEAMTEAFHSLSPLENGTGFVRRHGINIHHNFANVENHFGDLVVVHRKGATQAQVGQFGIIPGSMGSRSYIVSGKGVEDSYKSCSHGAGRTMSRNAAKKAISEADLVEQLKGTFTKPSSNFIDEAPGAYKPISEVMANQADLINIEAELKPIITIKG